MYPHSVTTSSPLPPVWQQHKQGKAEEGGLPGASDENILALIYPILLPDLLWQPGAVVSHINSHRVQVLTHVLARDMGEEQSVLHVVIGCLLGGAGNPRTEQRPMRELNRGPSCSGTTPV